ncbi:MAG: glycosyltransferase family 2 protein, partial [Flavobacteriales bacterium]|nr:glycosyltransferase family 2 protein [Flavobacteriales bacterium]
ELITRMDADDRMNSQKLEAMKVNLLKNGKGHIALGLVEYFSDTALGDGYRYYERWLNELTGDGRNYQDIYRECVIPSPCWMVHREDLDVCEAFEPNIYPEDYDLCFRFYKNNLKPIGSTKTLHYWRDHPTRTSRNDPHYADNRFLELKLNWFLKIDHEPTRPLVIWGAALKGKNLAKDLIKHNVNFKWACNNPNKIGKIVYDQKIHHLSIIEELNHPQIIIAVANKDEQGQIRQQLESKRFQSSKDFFFFC